ncbi:LytTR family DNA-binding domain-containing protein [Fulvivirgaceae bacterium BMA12]|uniref:LytTR family DNA-binding domain-containing protein n=1 Tax=Agaribacillus aureus TaxID=3051825 RepID=A0ABT8LGH4_9BACT|nr:LytTR family DNA-binding domain-containing protein [Fulvivirgaceae bacterium BMA12]
MNEDKISCIIVDDDLVFQTIIKGFIEKTDFLKIEGIFSNAIDAAGFLASIQIDLMFLDIEMPEMTGLELLKTLDDPPQIILISNQDQYALDAFEFNVADYLLKPINSYSRFLKAVSRTKANINKKQPVDTIANRHVFLKENGKLVKIDLESVHFVQGYGDYIKFITRDGVHVVYDNLREVKEKLPRLDFMQVHRSFIVRIDKIDSLDASMLKIDNQLIPVSRSFKKEVLARIKTL